MCRGGHSTGSGRFLDEVGLPLHHKKWPLIATCIWSLPQHSTSITVFPTSFCKWTQTSAISSLSWKSNMLFKTIFFVKKPHSSSNCETDLFKKREKKEKKKKKVVTICPYLLSASVTKPRIILQHLPTVSSKTNDGVPCNPTLSAVGYWGKQNSFLNEPHPLAYKSQQQLIPTSCTEVVKICGNRQKVSGNKQEKIPSVEQHKGMCIKRLYNFWPWRALYQTTNHAF